MSFKYKAFISYKHSTLGRSHAVALETALKRYAKPILKPPLKIFRDEQNMVPDNDLSELIKNGLKDSEYLFFIGERAAANSKWCIEELKYWCEKLKRKDKLILVLVADTIALNEETINWEDTDALPDLLKDYINTIPLYVDLSWAKEDSDRKLENPKYNSVINNLTAKLRGLTPEQMNGEELSTFRRNMRLRNRAIILLTILFVLAVIASYIALNQTKVARGERDRALRQSQISMSRQLVLQAQKQDGVKSILIGTEAWRFNEIAHGQAIQDVDEALRGALQSRNICHFLNSNEQVKGEILDSNGKWTLQKTENGIRILEQQGRNVAYFEKQYIEDKGIITENGQAILWNDTSHITKIDLATQELQTIHLNNKISGILSVRSLQDGENLIVESKSRSVFQVNFSAEKKIIPLNIFLPDKYDSVIINDNSLVTISFGEGAAYCLTDFELTFWDDLSELSKGISKTINLQLFEEELDEEDYFCLEYIEQCFLSPSGRYFVILCSIPEGSGPAIIWDLKDPKLRSLRIFGSTEHFKSAAFSSNEEYIALGSAVSGIDGISLSTGIKVSRIDNMDQPYRSSSDDITLTCGLDGISFLTFDSKGDRLLSIDGSYTRVWDLTYKKEFSRTWFHSNSNVKYASWIEEDNAVLSITEDGVFRRWNSMEPPGAPLGLTLADGNFDQSWISSAYSFDGKWIAAGGYGNIAVWKKGEISFSFDLGYRDINFIGFNANSNYLYFTMENGAIYKWEVGKPDPPAQIIKLSTKILGASLLFDGTQLAISTKDSTLQILELNNPDSTTFWEKTPKNIKALATHPQKDIVAWTFGKKVRIKNSQIDIEAKEAVFNSDVISICFLQDTLLVGTQEGLIYKTFLDNMTSEIVFDHLSEIKMMKVDPLERFLAVGNQNGQICLYDLLNGGSPAILSESTLPPSSLGFDPEGKWLLSSSSATISRTDEIIPGQLFLRPTTLGLIEVAGKNVWNNLTCEEWNQYIGSGFDYHRTFQHLSMPPDSSGCKENSIK